MDIFDFFVQIFISSHFHPMQRTQHATNMRPLPSLAQSDQVGQLFKSQFFWEENVEYKLQNILKHSVSDGTNLTDTRDIFCTQSMHVSVHFCKRDFFVSRYNLVSRNVQISLHAHVSW